MTLGLVILDPLFPFLSLSADFEFSAEIALVSTDLPVAPEVVEINLLSTSSSSLATDLGKVFVATSFLIKLDALMKLLVPFSRGPRAEGCF